MHSDSDSQLVRVSEKLEEVKGTVIQTIDNIMERGEKLEVLVDKTDRLDTEAFLFHKSATRLRQKMLCKKNKNIYLRRGVYGGIHLAGLFYNLWV